METHLMTTVRRIASSPLFLLIIACSLTLGGWTWVLASPPQQHFDEVNAQSTESLPVEELKPGQTATDDGEKDEARETPSSSNSSDRPESSPQSGLRPLELPDMDLSQLPQIAPEDDAAAARVIQNAINGKPLGGPVNDGLLSDVIQVIRKSSQINTSSLDPDLLGKDGTLLEPENNTESRVKRGARVRAAEQLLKASRLLERVGKDRSSSMDLVNRMRAEAVSLISE